MAGLSRVIEAMNDPDGRYAGFVSTHVLIPRSVSGAAITAILNSAAFSYLHLREFGAKQMTGGSCTIGKKELLATPIPAAILDPAVDRLVQDTPDGDELHALISRLYGLCESDADEIYQWWDVRSRAARRGGDARERANR